MDIYYHKNYTSTNYEFDTTRKSQHIAEELDQRLIKSPDAYLGTAEHLINKYHEAEYVDAVKTGRDIDLAQTNNLVWCANMYTAAKYMTAGMIAAVDTALLDNTISGTLSSGFHHARYDSGKGFCTFNGLALVAMHYVTDMMRNNKKVLILDFDAHCGGGTQSMIQHHEYSHLIHQIDLSTNSYDIYDETETAQIYIKQNDEQYIHTLQTILEGINPSDYGLILYNAGNDPYPEISHQTLRIRDEMVFSYCVANNIPCAFTIAGGYTDDQTMNSLVQSHLNTINAAKSSIQTETNYELFVEQMAELNQEALFADGLQDAIIGYTYIQKDSKYLVVYSAEKIIDVLMRDNEMTYEEAIEYADYNIFTAYMGENTPIYLFEDIR